MEEPDLVLSDTDHFSEDSELIHHPLPKKHHGPRRSRRQSVLAEELQALGFDSSNKDNKSEKSVTKNHWSKLAKEIKQARLKREVANKPDKGNQEENPTESSAKNGRFWISSRSRSIHCI